MKIWAHRGCSQLYPENTITAFEKAINIPGLEGIELDIQLTRDGEMVVIHDERVDRTTDGVGFVRDYTLAELKTLHIHTGTERAEHIPTMREVMEMLAGIPAPGIRLNIELKNGVYPYPGMEEKIVDMIHGYGIKKAVVYSSFYADSLVRVHELDPEAEIGVLDRRVSDCLYKAVGIESLCSDSLSSESSLIQGVGSGRRSNISVTDIADIALHPNGGCIDLPADRLAGRTVRAYFGGHLYPEKPTDGRMNLGALEAAGVTDVFLNEPEKYL